MAECTVPLSQVTTPEECYERFIEATRGYVHDYGGRNLDAIHDDLGDIEQPLTLIFTEVDQASEALGTWFDRFVSTIVASIRRSEGRLTVVFRGAAQPA